MAAFLQSWICRVCDVAWLKAVGDGCWICGSDQNLIYSAMSVDDPAVKLYAGNHIVTSSPAYILLENDK